MVYNINNHYNEKITEKIEKKLQKNCIILF